MSQLQDARNAMNRMREDYVEYRRRLKTLNRMRALIPQNYMVQRNLREVFREMNRTRAALRRAIKEVQRLLAERRQAA